MGIWALTLGLRCHKQTNNIRFNSKSPDFSRVTHPSLVNTLSYQIYMQFDASLVCKARVCPSYVNVADIHEDDRKNLGQGLVGQAPHCRRSVALPCRSGTQADKVASEHGGPSDRHITEDERPRTPPSQETPHSL